MPDPPQESHSAPWKSLPLEGGDQSSAAKSWCQVKSQSKPEVSYM